MVVAGGKFMKASIQFVDFPAMVDDIQGLSWIRLVWILSWSSFTWNHSLNWNVKDGFCKQKSLTTPGDRSCYFQTLRWSMLGPMTGKQKNWHWKKHQLTDTTDWSSTGWSGWAATLRNPCRRCSFEDFRGSWTTLRHRYKIPSIKMLVPHQ